MLYPCPVYHANQRKGQNVQNHTTVAHVTIKRTFYDHLSPTQETVEKPRS